MSNVSSSGNDQALERLTDYVVSELCNQVPPRQIADTLAEELEWQRSIAFDFVASVQSQLKGAIAGKHRKHLVYGMLWLVGGVIATLATRNAASEGGYYLVFWGAILWGCIEIVRGLGGLLGGKS